MTQPLTTLVFDAYGTLFDVHSVQRLAESFFPGKGAELSRTWRAKQLEYTWLRSLMGSYEDFNHVTGAALDWALESLKLPATEDQRRQLAGEYRKLALFPEVRAALEALARKRVLAILSNGHPEMLEAVVDHNGLRGLLRGGILSVHAAGRFKPHPSVYRIAEDHLGTTRSVVGFVSSNGWDAAGAKAFGFKAFWVNRLGQPVERLGAPPDAVVADLGALRDLLDQ